MNNKEKNEKYKELMGKLKRAHDNSFYYEEIFIEYAILEDRTDSLLKHGNYSLLNYEGKKLSLNGKIWKIRTLKVYKDKYIIKHINETLLSQISEWKNKRNKLIHNLVYCTYSNKEVEKIANEGYEIVKTMNNKTTLVNKYLDKNNRR